MSGEIKVFSPGFFFTCPVKKQNCPSLRQTVSFSFVYRSAEIGGHTDQADAVGSISQKLHTKSQRSGPSSTLRQNSGSSHLLSVPPQEWTPLGFGCTDVDRHHHTACSENGRSQPALPQDTEPQRCSAGAKLHTGEKAAAAAAAHAASGAQLRQGAPAPPPPQQAQSCCSTHARTVHIAGRRL